MHHRAPTFRTAAWFRRALRGLTILLLPAWMPETGHPTVLTRRRTPQPEVIYAVPYVRAIGSPALRFREAPVPPPELPARPVAGGPPQPKASVPEAPDATPAAESHPSPPADNPPVEAAPETPPAKPATPPAAILPDETRHKVREEDFLPFFQFPKGDVTVIAPVPTTPPAAGHPPPSSATYRQQ